MAIYDAPESLHVGNGVETVFGFDWPYLLPRDLIVTVNGQPVPTVLASPNQVAVTPAPAALAIVRIYRNTPAQNPTYLFATGIPMLPKYIDGNNKQLLYALQEGLLQFAETQATADAALAAAQAAQLAAEEAAVSAAQQALNIRRTLRVSSSDPELVPLPSVAARRGMVLGFDSAGQPVGTLPATGSGTELALRLADDSDAQLGAALVGRRRQRVLWSTLSARRSTVQLALDSGAISLWEYADAITDTPNPSDPATWDWAPAMQLAVVEAATLGKRLYIPAGQYTVRSTIVLRLDRVIDIYSDARYYTGDAIGATANAPVRFICDIPSGPFITTPGQVRTRIHMTGICAVNVSTVNPDCRFLDLKVFGSYITECFLHSFHGFIKGDIGFTSRITRNTCMNIRLTIFEGAHVDSWVSSNYLSMSVHTPGVVTAIHRGAGALGWFTDNFCEFAVVGIKSTAQTNMSIVGNTFDYIGTALDIAGVSGGMLSLNKFTHCTREYASRLALPPDDPLLTSDWICMKFGNTIRGLSIVGNVGARVDVLGSFKSTSYSEVRSHGNVVEPTTTEGAKRLWDVSTANADGLDLSENNGRVYTTSPPMTGVCEGHTFGVGPLRYVKRGGVAVLLTSTLNMVQATVTAPVVLDMSGLPLRRPLRLHVTVGAGFSTYSYKTYDIYREANAVVYPVLSQEANPTQATSTVVATGTDITITATGAAASKTLGYYFQSI